MMVMSLVTSFLPPPTHVVTPPPGDCVIVTVVCSGLDCVASDFMGVCTGVPVSMHTKLKMLQATLCLN